MLAVAVLGAGLVSAACAEAPEKAAHTFESARAELQNVAGLAVGTVTFEATPNGTLLLARLDGLPEGTHAFHVHGTGACEPPFKSAGGHLNPTGAVHGLRTEGGPHVGDFPNIHVPEGGSPLVVEYFSARLWLDASLFDGDGAAVVIHEGPDDYSTDPAGAAGSRIACGVIER